eukprot:5879064-Amphidinium_carterae.1
MTNTVICLNFCCRAFDLLLKFYCAPFSTAFLDICILGMLIGVGSQDRCVYSFWGVLWSIGPWPNVQVKQGGVILYCTCALAEQENDGVVAKFLKKPGQG